MPPSATVGELVRHEGHLYRIAVVDHGLVEFRPASDDAPWKDVTCVAADLRHGTPEQWSALVHGEVEALRQVAVQLPEGPTRTHLDAFCEAQPAALADRFAPEPYWYLPGRLLERHLLRSPT